MRPEKLTRAREQLLGPQTADRNLGPHNNSELEAIEDECVRAIIAMQERAGMQSATDGEFRRRGWWLELIVGWKGFAADRKGTTEMMWRDKDGVTQAFSRLWINGPIEWQESATVRAFTFLKNNTKLVPKVTLPAPNFIHMKAGGNKGIREGHYQDIDQFWEDLTRLTPGDRSAGGRGRDLHPVRRHQYRVPVRSDPPGDHKPLGSVARRATQTLFCKLNTIIREFLTT